MKFFEAVKSTSAACWRALRRPSTWVWLYPLVLLVPNVSLAITEYSSPMSKGADILLPLGIYLMIMSLWRRTGLTLVLCFVLSVLAAFQMVLLFLYGESIIAIDMYTNLFTTNVTEATELLGNLKIALVVVFILYLPPLGMGIYFMVRKLRCGARTLVRAGQAGAVCMVIGVICMAAAYVFTDTYSPRREMFPYNVIENLVTALRRNSESRQYHLTAAPFSYGATPTRDKNLREIYVLIIGETSRAANWQLMGYDRPTNPDLSERDNVTAFTKALSEINTTHKSVPMMMSYLTADNYGDSVAHTRSIFAAFNDCGYQTAFISNQRRNHSYIDFYGAEARSSRFISDHGGPQPDVKLAEALEQIIASSPSNKIFVVLHSYGSHFEYRKRYPASMAYFTPDNNSEASQMNRDQLINAYDNTVRYTDMFIDRVIATVEATGAAGGVLYASDHGEDIFDDRRERFLHSSPVPTYWQIHVPMLVWLSPQYCSLFPDKRASMHANATADVSTSASMFHTLIDIAGINTPYYNPSLSVTSDAYVAPPRRYLNDYNESVPFERAGLRQADFDELHRRNIAAR